MTTEQKIQMAEQILKSKSFYSFNSALLAEACSNEYIPEGGFIMENGGEQVYFEGGCFVTKKDGQVIRSFAKDSLPQQQQDQLFCLWAGKYATTAVNVSK